MEKGGEYTETVSSVAKAPGTPGARTVRAYCDLGLLPFVLDGEGLERAEPGVGGVGHSTSR